MAWHVLHGLLEQVKVQSTFPGKLWILTMFIFRIVVVARIGDNVYHDEQLKFVCNTLTPGCTNVCFNRFSPISQLRFWSLMVLVVSTPSILFFLYAMHKIYHAGLKYPEGDDGEKSKVSSQTSTELSYLHPPSLKRRRDSFSAIPNGDITTTPLYEVTKISNPKRRFKTPGLSRFIRRRKQNLPQNDVDDDVMRPMKTSVSDNNGGLYVDVPFDHRNRYPIYVDPHGRRIEFMKERKQKTPEQEAMEMRKLRTEMLKHPQIYRAYWWHALIRTACEIGFVVGQYYLYGITVPELFECNHWPCPKTVDCFVSRPQEKTCLLWLMYGLGIIASLLSILEFWSLGLSRTKTAFLCCTGEDAQIERKKRLAMLDLHATNHRLHKPISRVLSMESISTDTTVESV